MTGALSLTNSFNLIPYLQVIQDPVKGQCVIATRIIKPLEIILAELPAVIGPYAWPGKQKYSRLRCFLRVKGLVIYFYFGWSGSILQFRQNMIKAGSKSRLLTCSSNITLSLPS